MGQNVMVVVSEKMLQATMKKAVELRVFPKHDCMDHVAENYSKIEEILMAAMEEGEA